MKIYLQRVDEAAELLEPRAPNKLPQGSETVLLVEDEEGLRALLRTMLQRTGYTVLVAAGSDGAVDICRRHEGPIHLLLTDMVMPRMSGRELAEHLTPSHPEIRVLYMSGYTDDAIAHHGLSYGGTALLQKPFTADTLAGKVREVLDASGEPTTSRLSRAAPS